MVPTVIPSPSFSYCELLRRVR